MDENILNQEIQDHIDLTIQLKSELPKKIIKVSEIITNAINNNKKIILFGNGGSAADAQHIAAEFTGRFVKERVGLPAIALTTDTSALTAIGNDYSYDVIFSKQVNALGQTGDVLLGISTSGNSGNVIAAIESAHAKGMKVVAFTGKDGGKIGRLLKDGDVHLCVPADRTARIQETHLLLLHCLCDGIDHLMLD